MDTGSQQPVTTQHGTEKKEIKKSSWSSLFVGVLVLFSVISTGVANFTDSNIKNYYNEFYRLAYYETFTTWNVLVDIIRKDNVQDEEVVAYTSKTFLHALAKWIEKAPEFAPPQFAEVAHSKLLHSMTALNKDGNTLLEAIKQENSEQLETILRRMTSNIQAAEKDLADFKNALMKERDFSFHSDEELGASSSKK